MSLTLKTIVKEITPPIALRFIKSVGNFRTASGSEQGADYYDLKAEQTQIWRIHYSKTAYYPMWSVLVDRILRLEKKPILEIGCGGGQLAALMYDKGISKYLGFDFSPKCIEVAQKNAPQMKFEVANALETDLLDTHDYGIVVTTEFLEHIEAELEVIQKVRPGTHFYGTVPNFSCPSHVRHFQNIKEVSARYSRYFDNFQVDTFFHPSDDSIIYYLFEGVKR